MASAPKRKTAASDPREPLRDRQDRIARLHLEAAETVLPVKIEQHVRQWLSRISRELNEGEDMWVSAMAVTLAMELESFTPSYTGVTVVDRLARRHRDAADQAALQAMRSARFTVFKVGDPIKMGDLAGDDVFAAQDLATKRDFVLFEEEFPPEAIGMPIAARLCALDENDVQSTVGMVMPLDQAGLAVALDFVRPGRGIPHGHRCAAALYKHIIRHGGPRIVGLNDVADDLDEEETEAGPTALDLLLLPLIDLNTRDIKAPTPGILDEARRMVSEEVILEALYKAARIVDTELATLSAAYRRCAEVMIEAVHLRALAGSGADPAPLDTLSATIDRLVATGDLLRGVPDLFREIRRNLAAAKPKQDQEEGLTRVIERIRGLRAKTVDQGCTEEEALAAANKVAELLDRYGLSLDEVDLRRQACLGIGIESKRKRMGALDDCLPAVARFCDCRCWHERTPDGTFRSMLFGLPADVEAARYLYERVAAAFATETATFQKSEVYRGEAGEGRKRATTSFQFGLSRGIVRKLHDRKAERNEKTVQTSGRDLVPVKDSIVEDELAKLGLNFMSKAMPRGRMVALDAYEAGQVAAGRFEIQSELKADNPEARGRLHA